MDKAADETQDHPTSSSAGDAPDFTAVWQEIEEDIQNEADGALRIGLNLIKIRDALKPLGLWLDALRQHGMSQPQASRYIRYAQLPESDRALLQRQGLSIGRAVGEADRRKGAAAPDVDHSSTNSSAEAEIREDEQLDRLAEVEQCKKLALRMVDYGESRLVDEGAPSDEEYADDHERWRSRVAEIAQDVHAVLDEHLDAELRKRLLPGRP